jgi:hypothetical protein
MRRQSRIARHRKGEKQLPGGGRVNSLTEGIKRPRACRSAIYNSLGTLYEWEWVARFFT